MKYKVCARAWWYEWYDPGLRDRFGEENSIHELSDRDVVELILHFGRASIKYEKVALNRDNDLRVLKFENDYD